MYSRIPKIHRRSGQVAIAWLGYLALLAGALFAASGCPGMLVVKAGESSAPAPEPSEESEEGPQDWTQANPRRRFIPRSPVLIPFARNSSLPCGDRLLGRPRRVPCPDSDHLIAHDLLAPLRC
ncbi:MAG: hypothetical protein AB7O38_10255 [Pirellulaceae bacterium]